MIFKNRVRAKLDLMADRFLSCSEDGRKPEALLNCMGNSLYIDELLHP